MTIEDYDRSLRAFFNWMEREGHIELSPFNGKKVRFSNKHKKNTVIKNVSQEQLARIFAALTNPEQLKTFAGVRDLALFSILLDSGVRKGELLSMYGAKACSGAATRPLRTRFRFSRTAS